MEGQVCKGLGPAVSAARASRAAAAAPSVNTAAPCTRAALNSVLSVAQAWRQCTLAMACPVSKTAATARQWRRR